MMTNTDTITYSPLQQVVNFLGTAYLVSMVAYLLMRLFLGSDPWWLGLLNAFAIYTFTPLLVLIPLAALFGVWRTVVRLGLLALLGVVWFGPFFQPKPIVPATNPTLEVVTFNLWNDNNTRLADVEAWLRQQDADVVLLQEVPSAYRDGIDALRDLYPEQIMGGRLTLSRYPVVNTEDEAPANTPWERLVLDVEGVQVAVYNVHFAYPLGGPSRFPDIPGIEFISRYDETTRDSQINALLAVLENETLPYIVGGDFNLSQHSLTYSSLAVVMDDSFRETGAGLGATWPVNWNTPFPLLRLDYVWSNGLRPVSNEIGPELGSDHLPYAAVFELPDQELAAISS
ncbi:MAG: endonuclease/exonuclease/phosphatase family protein [Anaerolineae bacterium]